MKEEWKTSIADRYEVSNLGRVRRKGAGRPLKQGMSTPGYCHVTLYDGCGECKTYSVHSLVAKAFIPKYPEGFYVHHIDGDKLNNAAGNLEAVCPTKHSWYSKCERDILNVDWESDKQLFESLRVKS